MIFREFLYIIVMCYLAYETVREIVFVVKHKSCKRQVLATVTELRESSRGKHGSRFKATVRYTVGEQTYSEELHHSYHYDELSVGESVTVFVDERNPTVMLEPREKSSAIFRICVIPILALLLLLLIWASKL
ncbi:MAG: DUF3592 domain-containing protein [Clostridia bacterium]|nr:DUF3592 domain-containing protein [Clostridia bacterium]